MGTFTSIEEALHSPLVHFVIYSGVVEGGFHADDALPLLLLRSVLQVTPDKIDDDKPREYSFELRRSIVSH